MTSSRASSFTSSVSPPVVRSSKSQWPRSSTNASSTRTSSAQSSAPRWSSVRAASTPPAHEPKLVLRQEHVQRGLAREPLQHPCHPVSTSLCLRGRRGTHHAQRRPTSARALVPRSVDVRDPERSARWTRPLSSAVRCFTISCYAHPHRQMRVWWPERERTRVRSPHTTSSFSSGIICRAHSRISGQSNT
jgi:hypothetical protein